MLISKSIQEKVYKILTNGGVIAYPTDTVWGLGCLPDNEIAVKKIYELKKRDAKKPLILMSSKTDNLIPYVKSVSADELTMMKKYWPGALTIIMEKSVLTPDYLTSNMPTVGLRVPDNEVFAEIVNFCTPKKVLATTSANLSNQKSSLSKGMVEEYFGSLIDYIFDDYGVYARNIESTIIKVLNGNIQILRKGAIDIE